MKLKQSIIEKRLDVLEEAAKRLEENNKPRTPGLSLEDFNKILHEITTRPRPKKTQEEVIADFKASLVRRQADWELRHGK